MYYCPHHPQAKVVRYRIACNCRKPKPGMLKDAAGALAIDLTISYMIGDKIDDVQTGRNASCKNNILVLSGHDTDEAQADGELRPDFIAADLLEAALFIVNEGAIMVKGDG